MGQSFQKLLNHHANRQTDRYTDKAALLFLEP